MQARCYGGTRRRASANCRWVPCKEKESECTKYIVSEVPGRPSFTPCRALSLPLSPLRFERVCSTLRMCACDVLFQAIFLLGIWKFEIGSTPRHLLISILCEIVYLQSARRSWSGSSSPRAPPVSFLGQGSRAVLSPTLPDGLARVRLSRIFFRNKVVFTIFYFAKFRTKLGSDFDFPHPKFKPRGRKEHRPGP